MLEKSTKLNSPSWWFFSVPAAVVVAAWYCWPLALSWYFSNAKLEELTNKGVFGDSFGALNTLFSGLAFSALAYTMWMQRSELAETREILKSQKSEAEAQTKTLRQQAFDNTFFQLLRLHNEIVQAIDIKRSTGNILYGRDSFKFFYEKLENIYYKKALGMPANTNAELMARIEIIYSNFYQRYESDLGHYFRSIYNLVKFVHSSSLNEESKRVYTNLIRAQLSSNELKMLFYNCLSSKGREKFKPLVERYALLKHLDVKDNLHGDEDTKLFATEAFGV